MASFAELLRRSRFATFDPAIRQAYGAPPSHGARGNFGLKRPLANRRKNGYITLNKFEEPAQYIEWDNAEPQVRFIKRVEELNVTPSVQPGTNWYLGLGGVAASKESQMDSEFCPGETGMGFTHRAPPAEPISEDLQGLGTRGKNGYGAAAMQSAVSLDAPGGKGKAHLQPNIQAMSPREFDRYLEKLRALRPDFEQYLAETQRSELETYPPTQNSASKTIAVDNVESLSLKSSHMAFLGHHTHSQFSASTPEEMPEKTLLPKPTIRQQPHRYAGLTYYTPTAVESYYSSPVEDGLVLHHKMHDKSYLPVTQRDLRNQPYVASFAGLSAELPVRYAGADVHQLMDPRSEKGVSYPRDAGDDPLASAIAKSTKKVRLFSLEIDHVPRTSGSQSSAHPLKQTRVNAKVAVNSAVDQHDRDNQLPIGSRGYNGLTPPEMLQGTRFAMGVPAGVRAGIAARQVGSTWGSQGGSVGVRRGNTDGVAPGSGKSAFVLDMIKELSRTPSWNVKKKTQQDDKKKKDE